MSRSSRTPRARASLAAVAAVAVLLAGCSGGSDGDGEGDGPAPDSDVAALAAEVATLSTEDREARLAEEAHAVEHEMLELSGLEDELGGPEAAAESYDAMVAALTEAVLAHRVDPGYTGRFAASAAADTPSLGAMLFASLMMAYLAPEGMVTSTNDLKPGDPPVHDVQQDAKDGNSSSLTRDGTVDSASMDWTVETTKNGVTGKVRIAMTVNPCPLPDGTFTASARIETSATSSGGRVGSSSTVSIAIAGRVDDDARLAGYDVETTSEAAKFGSGSNVWAEATDREARTGTTITAYTRTLGRSAGNVPEGFANQWANAAMLTQMTVTSRLLEAAQKGWESGRCVSLDPTTSPGRTGLAPSTTVTITAAPRSRVDGGAVGGGVTATLSGDTSVDPASTKVPADATFTYVAPGEPNQSATVSLEARSRRGVARATVAFDTSPAAYDAAGTLASAPSGTTFVGTICRTDQPFTVQTAGDMVGTITFTPAGPDGGTLVFAGQVGNAPFAMDGAGAYTITPPSGAGTGTLDATWQVTIHIPIVGDQTNGGPFTLTLTPRAAC